ncbi:MAG: RNA methyltransferase [bacterium]|nr:RNA methyltransferase [bacterium]
MITSRQNPRVSAVRKLRRRRERKATGLTTVESPNLVHEAIAGGVRVHEIFALPGDDEAGLAAENAGIGVTEISMDVLERMASSVTPRGPIAVIEIPPPPAIEARDTIVLWEMADPGNAGTVIRTAAAFGFQVLATAGSVDLWAPKVIRSAVGGHFRTPVVERVKPELKVLEEAGLLPLATAADGVDIAKVDLSDDTPMAFIIGNEAHGLPAALTSRATTLSLSMPGGTESLNAAVSAGIFMYLRMSGRS